MTVRLYLEDGTLREAVGVVVAASSEGVELDRTPFYPRAGGQPGDAGVLRWDGGTMDVSEARKGEGGTVLHVPVPGAAVPAVGMVVRSEVDWLRRFGHMRMHTAMHLLCALLPGASVTGGQVGAERSRLDFDLAVAPDKDDLDAGLAALVAADHVVTVEWVDEAVLDANPGLVRTLSVRPPRGSGRVRLVRIGAEGALVDVQPCGGTHVARTGQIGGLRVLKVENKGRQNRRISIGLTPAGLEG